MYFSAAALFFVFLLSEWQFNNRMWLFLAWFSINNARVEDSGMLNVKQSYNLRISIDDG